MHSNGDSYIRHKFTYIIHHSKKSVFLPCLLGQACWWWPQPFCTLPVSLAVLVFLLDMLFLVIPMLLGGCSNVLLLFLSKSSSIENLESSTHCKICSILQWSTSVPHTTQMAVWRNSISKEGVECTQICTLFLQEDQTACWWCIKCRKIFGTCIFLAEYFCRLWKMLLIIQFFLVCP